MERINVLVGGATGYVGQEAVSILNKHPNVDEVMPFGRDLPSAHDLKRADAAILALPHEERGRTALYLHKLGKTVVDLAATFRLPTAELYKEAYAKGHIDPTLLPVAYGLPEIWLKHFLGSTLVAGPGCYPTAVSLVTVPLVEAGLVGQDQPIKIVAESGTSGLGKAQKAEADSIEASGETQPPYATGREHRHVSEIEQFLDGRQIDFTARLGPYFRGITAQIDVPLAEGVTAQDVHSTLAETYAIELLVRVLPFGETPEREWVVGTDSCHIGVVEHDDGVQVVSIIDNLRKGAAGQGVQDLNIMYGFPEYAGLDAA